MTECLDPWMMEQRDAEAAACLVGQLLPVVGAERKGGEIAGACKVAGTEIPETIPYGNRPVHRLRRHFNALLPGHNNGFRLIEYPVLPGNLETFKVMPWAESVPVVVKMEHSLVADNLHFPENRTFAVNASESVCPVESKPCKPLSHLLFAARVYLDVLIGISEVIGADDAAVRYASGRFELLTSSMRHPKIVLK